MQLVMHQVGEVETRLFVISVIIVTTIIESPVSTYTIRHRRDTGSTQNDRSLDLDAKESSRLDTRSDYTRANNLRVTDYGGVLEKLTPAQTSAKVYEIKGDPPVDDKVELTTAFILLKTDNGYLKLTGLPIYTNPTDAATITTQELPYDATEIMRQRRQKIEDNIVTTQLSDETDTFIPSTISENTTNIPNQTKTSSPDITTTNIYTKEPSDTQYSSKVENTQAVASDPTAGQASETTSSIPVPVTWKKYTTIDRKRGNNIMQSSNESSSEADTSTQVNLENSPTRVSLEKLLSESLIPSLEKLGEDLSKTSMSPLSSKTVAEEKVKTPAAITAEYTLAPIVNLKQSSTRTLHLTSMRAGFLDYSAKPIDEEATTIIENVDTINQFKESEKLGASYELQGPESQPVTKNKSYSSRAHSQLADDVLREELLREETLLNNEESLKRNQKEVTQIDRDENEKTSPILETVLPDSETGKEDVLKVKPIEKNAALYTVSSNNYKPLKKIDVQSLKPLVRNPDDNSWRNESISSLGIVFKAKPASKNYTQVLKNKTETLFNNNMDKDSKGEVPDLRERLEKIAEVRKSKKKKVIDKFGEAVYADYEETVQSAEVTTAKASSLATQSLIPKLQLVTTDSPSTDHEVDTYSSLLDPQFYTPRVKEFDRVTTAKPKKYKSVLEYYDTTDEEEAEYINLPKIDLKKFKLPKQTPVTTVTVPTSQYTKPAIQYWPDRKPTLQYFPPRATQKININEYADRDLAKLNYYTYKETKNTPSTTYATVPAAKYEQYKQSKIQPADLAPLYKSVTDESNAYQPQRGAQSHSGGYVDGDDGNYDRPTYVIKHYKDFINEAVNDAQYEKNLEYESAYTRSPLRGVTVNELAAAKAHDKANIDDENDYETQFRKDILSSFVENFNQNSDRFKVDFPILYNNSVVHGRPVESGRMATSSAFVKRLYGDGDVHTATRVNNLVRRPCEHCDNITVELSPAYELHYYVPEQEEKEEADPRPVTLAYRYQL